MCLSTFDVPYRFIPIWCNTFANMKTLQMIYKYDNISEVLEGKQKQGGHSSAHIVVIATPRFLPWA